MAVDMFLKLDGVTGESADSKHKNEIDILSWSWGASQSGTTHMGSGGGGGKVSVQDLHLTKYLDKSSPTLFKDRNGRNHRDQLLDGRLWIARPSDRERFLELLQSDEDLYATKR